MSTPSLLNIPYRFKAGTLYSQLPETGAGDFTVTRATTPTAGQATRINAAGLIETVADNVPRLDYPLGGAVNGCPALLVEPSAVNLALHSRDLTQAAWVASGITPLRNAVGMDGAANTGTTLTATGANGTILQTLTHASQVRAFSAYVRRTVGTGTIEITTNGGTTWTPITLTSAYTRFSTTATVTNGQVGFRIVTSGDAIVVDYCQGEVGTVATSAIPTTTAAVTRSADVISRTSASALIGQTEGTIYAEVDLTNLAQGSDVYIITQLFLDGSNRMGILTRKNGANDIIEGYVLRLGGFVAEIRTNDINPGIFKVAFGYKLDDFVMYVNGSLIGSDTSGGVVAANQVQLGHNNGSGQLNNRLRAVALYPNRIPNTAAPGVLSLATLTAP